jgi:benzoyl-CoA reductase/2-hydroxyglutaryl-CoA dehydratase subunit BcrC/BadD/HgdB
LNKCCGKKKKVVIKSTDPCSSLAPTCGAKSRTSAQSKKGPLAWFDKMIENCHKYASSVKDAGRPIVGIMCEYTPRELIMAAGGVPICLCGGSIETIPAAEENLPSNLCPLIKSTYGYHIQKSNPFLEMASLIVAETTCDGKKKMYELMAESRPMYVLELPQKSNDKDAFNHWVLELRKFKTEMEKRFKVKITDNKIKKAIQTMNQERALRRKLAALMKSKSPPLTGRQLLNLKSTISGIPADFKQYEKALKIFKNKSANPDLSSRVRVLMTGVPIVHGAEKVLDIIEDRGGLVVCQENCTGVKPISEDVNAKTNDPIKALAEKYFRIHCSVMTKNNRRVEALRHLASEYRPDCIIELIWQACLTYDIESLHIKRLAEKELGVPYLRIETDYSPSDSARIAVRVEALFETVKNKK